MPFDRIASRRRFLTTAGITAAAVAAGRLVGPAPAKADTVAGWVGRGMIQILPGDRSGSYALPAGFFPAIGDGQAVIAMVQGDAPDYWVASATVSADPTGTTAGSVTVFLNMAVKSKASPVAVYFETSGVVAPLP